MVQRNTEKRKVRSISLKFGTLNVGSMTGKSTELADIMERRKADFVCAGNQVKGQQGQKIWKRLQPILPWCGWKEKWSRRDCIGRIC